MFKKLCFASLLVTCFFGRAEASFVVDAVSEVQFDVAKPRTELSVFDTPEFVARHLPGLEGIAKLEEDIYEWDFRIRVPLARDMRGKFPARKNAENADEVTYESADVNAEDYMLCRIAVDEPSALKTTIKISIQLKFTRENALKFHWMAPFLGETFLSARVTEKLDAMMAGFVESAQLELNANVV